MCLSHGNIARRSVLAAGLALPFAAMAGTAEAAPSGPFAIVCARIFDGRRVIECGTVVVDGGHIIAVHEGAPPRGLPVHDGRGKTLLPGLIDGHVHHTNPDRTDAPRFGVTTELDMVSDPGAHGPIRRQRRSYAPTPLSDLWTAGWWATVPGGWGTDSGIEFPLMEPGTDPAAFVAARHAEGSDHLKLALEDVHLITGARLPVLSEAQVRGLIAAAKRHDMPSVAHATRQDMARTALAAGITGLVHLFSDAEIADDVVRLAVRSGVFVTPTLTLWSALGSLRNPATKSVITDPRVAPLLSAKQRGFLDAPWGFERPGVLETASRNVAKLHAAGVPITAGTDSGIPGIAHGVSLLVELELLVRAGLTPVQALAAATSTPAAHDGFRDRGRIARGLRADLVLVNGDPTRDITALRDISAVWRNGAPVKREL
ncbi:amidohydrolase family protein [Amycolatopsis sp. cg5]|uniref:amidohydrolase family protein n=1 Tax=Amycolatopsis sp. cg5 TaxID=3238802 RepID=UPI0035238DD3